MLNLIGITNSFRISGLVEDAKQIDAQLHRVFTAWGKLNFYSTTRDAYYAILLAEQGEIAWPMSY
ncbi:MULTISPECIES: hypothetical protein [Aliiglaciecola]|uniref:hypothetical protein n=1 Tax=Aliiglaciecola TaxID=1406885 RepID=UPI001C092C4E|nr:MULTISPECIES: hypothetical protein [Aliiglaciecola]MBU2878058.1 hypothetical protein [Aliiglaciecola lipolytica]MDO6709423.1 hypothetical protein [Aliiglaciecola sp. 2_MG-2023]MDO6750571.1 hypothetical protein [Aliiglaciecola sp. 1_MG-2023]